MKISFNDRHDSTYVRYNKYLSNFFDVGGSYTTIDLKSNISARSVDKSTRFSQFLHIYQRLKSHQECRSKVQENLLLINKNENADGENEQ